MGKRFKFLSDISDENKQNLGFNMIRVGEESWSLARQVRSNASLDIVQNTINLLVGHIGNLQDILAEENKKGDDS